MSGGARSLGKRAGFVCAGLAAVLLTLFLAGYGPAAGQAAGVTGAPTGDGGILAESASRPGWMAAPVTATGLEPAPSSPASSLGPQRTDAGHFQLWDAAFHPSGVENDVHAIVSDGQGNLYVGGKFKTAGGEMVNHVARWDGSHWHALGSGMAGGAYQTSVNALAIDNQGNLYAGGYFDTAGGKSTSNIAMWDGARWSALGQGVIGGVSDLAVDAQGNLYAGGSINQAGGNYVKNIAMWDGESWHSVGGGMSDNVFALAADAHGNVYAGGNFRNAGGEAVNFVAKWDGQAWSDLGGGVSSWVFDLAIGPQGNLFAVGTFWEAGGVAVSRIAMWDGVGWSALGDGLNRDTQAVAVDGQGLVYAFGDFDQAGGQSISTIACWDGAAWLAVGEGVGGLSYGYVYVLAVDENDVLYAGGELTTAGAVGAAHIASWDGVDWSALGGGQGLSGYVYSAAAGPDGVLYVGGDLTAAGGVAVNNVARWDGLDWSALGDGIDDTVRALAVGPEGQVYANGSHVWDGSSWEPLGGGIFGRVDALAVDSQGTLYAGGYFSRAGDVSAANIAQWDGQTWTAMGSGADNTVYALVVDSQDILYAGGWFDEMGGQTAHHVARWDGSSWSALGGGAPSTVFALTLDPAGNLYAGGYADDVVMWNGSFWTALGADFTDTFDPPVKALAADPAGNIYVGGDFEIIAGQAAGSIARWDGSQWSTLWGGVDYEVWALEVDSAGDLFAGGWFVEAGGRPAASLARASWTELPHGACIPRVGVNDCPDFFDDFSDPASGWPSGESGLVAFGYVDGEYRIRSKSSDYFYIFRSPACPRESYVVDVDARWQSTPGSSYGLLFGIGGDFSRYYLFEINTDYALYRLMRKDGPGDFKTLVGPDESGAIRGGQALNHMTVRRIGDFITIEINGTAVIQNLYDSQIGGLTSAGIMMAPYWDEDRAEARFDNFATSTVVVYE